MAKKDVIVLKCKKCGEEFLYEYRGTGKKPDYCEDCRKLISLQYQRDYRNKMRNTETKVTEMTSGDKYGEFIEKISKCLNTLDGLRVEMCEISKEINEYQSSFDKNDQVYLHRLENIDVDNTEETMKMLKEWKASRNGRRNTKELIAILGSTINAIPYKNYANALPILKGSAYIKR